MSPPFRMGDMSPDPKLRHVAALQGWQAHGSAPPANIGKNRTVSKMKAHWAEIEAKVRDGESFEVLNRGRPTARISPAKPREILKWEDHLASAAKGKGQRAKGKGRTAVREDREGRW